MFESLTSAIIAQAAAASQGLSIPGWAVWIIGTSIGLGGLGWTVAGAVVKKARAEGKAHGALEQRVAQTEQDANDLWSCHRAQDEKINKMNETLTRVDERTETIREDLKTLVRQTRRQTQGR